MQRIPPKTLKKSKSINDKAMEEFNKELDSMYDQIQKDIKSTEISESDTLEEAVDKMYRELCRKYPLKSTPKPRDTSSKKTYMNRTNNDWLTPKTNSTSSLKTYYSTSKKARLASTSKKTVRFSDFRIKRSSSSFFGIDKLCAKKLFPSGPSEESIASPEKRRLQIKKEDQLCSEMILSPGIDSLQNCFNVETINNTNLNKSSENKEDSSGEFQQLEIDYASPTKPTQKLTTANENQPSFEALMNFVINENMETQKKITKFMTDAWNENNAKIAAKFAEFQEKYGQISNSIKLPLQTNKY